MAKKFCIQTFLGSQFDPATGEVDYIHSYDIAHSLSNICRYAGHCRKFYSVAEHSVLVSKIVRSRWPDDVEARWAALLHDATEAFVCDLPTQIKVLLPDYQRIEDALAEKIREAFGVRYTKEVAERVKFGDQAALATEAPRLFNDVSSWESLKTLSQEPQLLDRSFPLGPSDAKLLFLNELAIIERELSQHRKPSE